MKFVYQKGSELLIQVHRTDRDIDNDGGNARAYRSGDQWSDNLLGLPKTRESGQNGCALALFPPSPPQTSGHFLAPIAVKPGNFL